MKYQKNQGKKCKVKRCINPAVSLGVCKIHYSRFRTHKSFENRKYPTVAKYSNLVKSKGKWQSPVFYRCKFCGLKLTNKNLMYRNAFKYHNYTCKNCARKRTKNYYRKHQLNSSEGVILLKRKVPAHPKDNKCMLCHKPPTRRTGLNFHHWLIKNDIAYGLWLCNICHMFAERFDNNFVPLYIKLKKQYLFVGKKEI